MIEQLLYLVLIAAIGGLVLYAIRRCIRSTFLTSKIPPRYIPVIDSATRWTVVIAMLVIAMRALGLTASTVLASLSAFAVVAAVAFFAYWSVLSNGLCSILLLLFQPFRVGDRIEVRENEINIVAEGVVTGMNLIYVTLKNTSPEGTESQFQIPANLLFQRTIRVWLGDDTKSLGQAYAEDNLDIEPKRQKSETE